ncbi:MAG TPA: hypothetical protein PK776_01260 [Flavobacterium sp.]|nr:hypothetical protein [Flavobacterium sp.]
MTKHIFILLSIVLLYSCTEKKDIQMQIKNDINLKISDYTVLNTNSESAPGDYSSEFRIYISHAEIKIYLDSLQYHKDQKWKKIRYGYRYEFSKEKDVFEQYEIDTINNIISYLYYEL